MARQTRQKATNTLCCTTAVAEPTDRTIKVVYTLSFINYLAFFMSKFPLIIEPEDLAQQLPLNDNVVIIEQASLDDFNAGHIPGSLWLDFKELQAESPYPGFMPKPDFIAALFSRLGINNDTHIICSDGEGGGWAGRLIWILDCIGHTHYSFLNGGLTAWKQSQLAVATDNATITPSHYQVTLTHPEYSVSKAEILSQLDDSRFVVWDARSAAEYSGEKANAARGGHIPGAKHYEWTQALDAENGLKLRPLESIKQELRQLGINRHLTVITHCQTHHRSGLTYFIGKLLDFDIRGYAGSWSEWGNDPNTPITLGEQP